MPQKIHNLLKTKMLSVFIAIVLTCGVIFTSGGNAQFHKVLAMMPYMAPYMEIDFKDINPSMTERLALSQFTNLTFKCSNKKDVLGERICWAAISRINNIAADHVAFFYKHGKLARIKVGLSEQTFKDTIAHLDREYGKHPTLIQSRSRSDGNLLVWSAGSGVLVSQAQTPKNGKPTLLWINRGASTQHTLSGKHQQPYYFKKKLKPPTDV